MYQVELVWNREFDWVRFSDPKKTRRAAIIAAKDIRDSGDGARVKKVRVVDEEGNISWNGYGD